jgi:hypothetical protein
VQSTLPTWRTFRLDVSRRKTVRYDPNDRFPDSVKFWCQRRNFFRAALGIVAYIIPMALRSDATPLDLSMLAEVDDSVANAAWGQTFRKQSSRRDEIGQRNRKDQPNAVTRGRND